MYKFIQEWTSRVDSESELQMLLNKEPDPIVFNIHRFKQIISVNSTYPYNPAFLNLKLVILHKLLSFKP